jgi:aerobic-type carbon monoxide dehydrogenase small subunit (CoxS/CutS family)
MDDAQSGRAKPHEQLDAPEHVAPDVTGTAEAADDEPVTRRRALSGGALAVLGGTIVAAGATLGAASDALASTPKARASAGGTKLNVNGENVVVSYAPDTMLLYVLRDELHLRGPKFGCGLSECGACAVLADGKQIRSCVTPLSTVGKRKIVTLDGLAASYHGKTKAKKGALHPLQQAWIDEQVPQCGYCQSGMIIQAADLLSSTPRPSEAQIKTNMNGHLCRCGTYNGIVRAIQRASEVMAK